jgi:hypothetical protein
MSVVINGSAGVTTNSGAVYDGIQRGTAVTASGTSVDFTSIPSWVKRITVIVSGLSTNGSSAAILQIGSGSVEATGYLGSAGTSANGVVPNVSNYTTSFGFAHTTGTAAGTVFHYTFVLTNVSGNTWVCSGTGAGSSGAGFYSSSGNKTTSGVLDRVRITTAGGTDQFDAGTINILFE